ncbi:hypothetical protein MSG28_015074 [Choristoneura fumiferana]|uniref:Uncharacterized protein n=1 Tax=Choristoneura fumiferana TaxID=7141 RepID=A0ACC0KYZ6_CHOFU|nr:hypothetical protein MSG28_015074 [Choristoneura fumiferana]
MHASDIVNSGGLRKSAKQLNPALLPSSTTRRRGSTSSDQPKLNMDKCLIVSKVTRYEYEKHSQKQLNPAVLLSSSTCLRNSISLGNP